MGKIYCVMGKSSSGKDSIYSRIMQQGNPALLRIVPYTTRPRREGETDGCGSYDGTSSRVAKGTHAGGSESVS